METQAFSLSEPFDSDFGGDSDFGENAHGAFGDFSSPSPTPMIQQKMARRASCGGRFEHPSTIAEDDHFAIIETRSLTPPPRDYVVEHTDIVDGKTSKKKPSRRKSNDSKHSEEDEADRAERRQRRKERKAEKTRRRRSNEREGDLDISSRTSKTERPRRRRSNDDAIDNSLSLSQHDKPRRRKSNDSGKGEQKTHRMRRRSSCGPGTTYSYSTMGPAAVRAPADTLPRVQRRPSLGSETSLSDPPKKKTLDAMLAREDSANTVKTEAMSVFSDETFQTTASGRRRRVPRRMSAPHSYTDPDCTQINNQMAVATVGIISEARGLRW